MLILWVVGWWHFVRCVFVEKPLVSMKNPLAERPPRLFDALGTARGAVVERYAYCSRRPWSGGQDMQGWHKGIYIGTSQFFWIVFGCALPFWGRFKQAAIVWEVWGISHVILIVHGFGMVWVGNIMTPKGWVRHKSRPFLIRTFCWFYIDTYSFDTSKLRNKFEILGRTLTWSMLIFWYLPATKTRLRILMFLATREAPAFDLNVKSYLGPLILECVFFLNLVPKKDPQF